MPENETKNYHCIHCMKTRVFVAIHNTFVAMHGTAKKKTTTTKQTKAPYMWDSRKWFI